MKGRNMAEEQGTQNNRADLTEQQLQERSAEFDRKFGSQEVKPASQLSTPEIVAEARELHAHFNDLKERFEQAPATQRSEIREEMQPLVNRERELRQEYTGRLGPELTQDRVPDLSYGR